MASGGGAPAGGFGGFGGGGFGGFGGGGCGGFGGGGFGGGIFTSPASISSRSASTAASRLAITPASSDDVGSFGFGGGGGAVLFAPRPRLSAEALAGALAGGGGGTTRPDAVVGEITPIGAKILDDGTVAVGTSGGGGGGPPRSLPRPRPRPRPSRSLFVNDDASPSPSPPTLAGMFTRACALALHPSFSTIARSLAVVVVVDGSLSLGTRASVFEERGWIDGWFVIPVDASYRYAIVECVRA